MTADRYDAIVIGGGLGGLTAGAKRSTAYQTPAAIAVERTRTTTATCG